jgi:hypothetical protein
VAWNPESKSEVFLSKGVRLFVVVPDLGWLMTLTLLVVASPLVFYALARWKKRKRQLPDPRQSRRIPQHSAAGNDAGHVYSARPRWPLSIARRRRIIPDNPRRQSLHTVGFGRRRIHLAPLSVLLLWRRPDLERSLPSADNLDRITYKTICLAFPLLTLMIASGAYWANQTWGSYWSWDPKETWAAITWLVYAGYLHMRITRGWRGRRAAYFAILGFAVVMFTFFGVTYLLPGLHAYA